jgi:hypothetical protein
MNKKLWILSGYALVCSGCASTPVYKDVFNEKPAFNQKAFPVAQEKLYQAALRTICSKNFLIEKESEQKDFFVGRRAFQKGKRTTVLILQAKIMPDSESSSTIYLNALETTERSYVADRTRFFLFIIPLPGGGGKEATEVKEGEKVIEDKEFYGNFFAEIEKSLKTPEAIKAVAVFEQNAGQPTGANDPIPVSVPGEKTGTGNTDQE